MRILRHNQLAEKGLTYSREHLRRLERAGKFPRRIKLSKGGDFYGYAEHEIDAYLEARAAAQLLSQVRE